MFNGHLDVVGVDGMMHAPWDADRARRAHLRTRLVRHEGRRRRDVRRRGARGRRAARRTRSSSRPSPTRSSRASARARSSSAACAPTRRSSPSRRASRSCRRTSDSCGSTSTTHGRAAHGSRWDLGVDAIRHAGLFLAELDRIDAEDLPTAQSHPLLGRPSVHASLIEGGTGMSTYPDRCAVRIERRTIPGETPADVRARARRRVRSRRGTPARAFAPTCDVTFAQAPSDVARRRADRARARARRCGDAASACASRE